MGRTLAAAATLLVLLIASARPAVAALEITLSVSPTEARVGDPVEVLVRTFLPVGRDDVGLPAPSMAYPVASGVWNILYPVDYLFDIVATGEEGAPVAVPLQRDARDSTLWRGVFRPFAPGTWTVVARNFGVDQPGASAVVRVRGESAPPIASSDSLVIGAVIAVGVILVFLAGIAVGRLRFPLGKSVG